MGSDIYTESAVAVRFDDFLNSRKELNKKPFRNVLVDELIESKIVSATDHLGMRNSKSVLVDKLVDLEISQYQGGRDCVILVGVSPRFVHVLANTKIFSVARRGLSPYESLHQSTQVCVSVAQL